jgi:hypothetical protein
MDEFHDLVRGLKLRLCAETPNLLENPQDAEKWGYIFIEAFKTYDSDETILFILGRSTADAVLAYIETNGDNRIDTFIKNLIRAYETQLKILLKLDSLPLTS